jgi:hypothetical protein
MRLSTIIIIFILIFSLYYYTAETFDMVEIVGKNVYSFVANVVLDFKEGQEKGTFDDIKEDLEKKEKTFKEFLNDLFKKN